MGVVGVRRGMRDLTVPQDFKISGGAELACVSTTKSIDVVAAYASSEVRWPGRR